ncbi:transcriptional regulator [Francisella halioticida]|uniref:DNA-binding protein HU n=1 Tax=Francisella halioticida TaxID=549298 RepID=A0ABM6M1S1_9GAMM|nr:HU family DNA-binding protein [Francisella halioticida]ASG68926.1 DNA-binding protein HU [Francisella halioticida]BCD92205.1 transcriptional regulator [Francisella halioticida]
MNKNELIHTIAADADVSLEIAKTCLDALTNAVTDSLKKKEDVTLVGFGTFQAKKRAARDGRNPKTGEPIKIAAATVPSFKAGKTLKDTIKG